MEPQADESSRRPNPEDGNPKVRDPQLDRAELASATTGSVDPWSDSRKARTQEAR